MKYFEFFKPLIHESWHKKLEPVFSEPFMIKLFETLKNRQQKTYPTGKSKQLFRCFKETTFNNIKAIFVGFSPYYTEFQGVQTADGRPDKKSCIICWRKRQITRNERKRKPYLERSARPVNTGRGRMNGKEYMSPGRQMQTSGSS